MQKVVRDTYWKHSSSSFTLTDEDSDPTSPDRNERSLAFGRKKKAENIAILPAVYLSH